MYAFINRQLGALLAFPIVLLCSLFLSVTFADAASAIDGTWTDSGTITVNGVAYKGPTDGFINSGGSPNVASNYKVFTPTNSAASRLYFNPTTNFDTSKSGSYTPTGFSKDAQTLSLTNTRATAGTVPTTPPVDPDAAQESTGSSCAIDGVGWLICPLATFLAKINDGAYAVVEKMLVFEIPNPFSTDPEKNAIYGVWASIRNVANILFVIAFFAVIFSQATSVGISAYGIRKMLPRIIVAAILVNLSYYLCIFAIDISNIIGAAFDGLIGAAAPEANKVNGPWEEAGSAILAGQFLAASTGAMIAIAVFFSGFFLALAATAFLAIFFTLIILLVRHALLILLIVLSPLAFVAYILPNTESIFDKWRKTFISLLVMYPLIALLFAGAQLASDILMATHQGDAATGGWVDKLYLLMALGVLTIPLFGIPWIVKFSGGALARFSGAMNNKSKGLVDRARKYGEKGAADRRTRLGAEARIQGNSLADRARNKYGKNADGTDKEGKMNRLARTAGRGVGYAASRPQRSWDKTKDRELRASLFKSRDEEAYWNRMADTETITSTETDADGNVQTISKKTPTAAASKMASNVAMSGGAKMQDKVLRTATEAIRKDFVETRGRSEGDASEMGLYAPGSNYKKWAQDPKDGQYKWIDIGSDTGGAAVHLTQKHQGRLGRILVQNAKGETHEISGDDADGYMAKAAINMAAKAADGSAMTRMMGLKGDPGVDSSLIDSLNQSIASNASGLAPKFQGLFAGTDAINGATPDTVSGWHGGQFILEGRRLAYNRREAAKKVQVVRDKAANNQATPQELQVAEKEYSDNLDQYQTWYTGVENAVEIMKTRAAASGKSLSPGKLEAFETFKTIATAEGNKYDDPQYDFLFTGGKRPDELHKWKLDDDDIERIRTKVKEEVQKASPSSKSGGGTTLPRNDIDLGVLNVGHSAGPTPPPAPPATPRPTPPQPPQPGSGT